MTDKRRQVAADAGVAAAPQASVLPPTEGMKALLSAAAGITRQYEDLLREARC